jgi:hypothetical protein
MQLMQTLHPIAGNLFFHAMNCKKKKTLLGTWYNIFKNNVGFATATIHATKQIINTSYNQFQLFFTFKSWSMDVVIREVWWKCVPNM